MGSVAASLTIHQLLGRIVYFHALFIEPSLAPSAPSRPGPVCCNHGPEPDRGTISELLTDSAWAALVEVATTLPAHDHPCPKAKDACCATCRVVTAAAAVGAGWARTEHRSYQRAEPAETLLRACELAAAARLGRAFATQHTAWCPALDQLSGPVAPPATDELPLTGELLALWANPIADVHRPVTNWLNHCTGLDDVRRVLETRSTES
ncbi:hypothetical protein [Micromonospora aurantiaca (nom. illeg.)]|uniref:hypothetical protein n=1 Tax=Micromonospora aurantiaca (nom. illeg.) TaxID=47850 RepID=UPI0033CF0193